MKNEETCEEMCKFTVHPCNFKVEVKEIKPFCVCSCKAIVLDLKVINPCNINSCIQINSKPMHGKLFLLGSSILIYKSHKKFCGLDFFEILVEDECGTKRVEPILIHVI